jgi:hypothetical protein
MSRPYRVIHLTQVWRDGTYYVPALVSDTDPCVRRSRLLLIWNGLPSTKLTMLYETCLAKRLARYGGFPTSYVDPHTN